MSTGCPRRLRPRLVGVTKYGNQHHWLNNRPVQQYLAKFIQHLEGERNLSPYTVRNYRTDLAPFFHFLEAEGTGGLEAVVRRVFRRFVVWLLKVSPILLYKSKI